MKLNFQSINITRSIWEMTFILSGLVLIAVPVPAQEEVPLETDSIVPQDDESSQAGESVSQYLDQITERENAHGPYDPQLGEQLLGLGLLYKNRGDYEDAANALQRSLNIKRINEGIQDIAQVPVLSALIEVNTAARNWDELDHNYHLLLWVMKRNLKSGDPGLLPFIEAVGRWKLIAYNNGLLDEPPQRTLSNMIDVYQSTVDTMQELYGKHDPRLIGPLKGLSLARYQLVQFVNNTPVSEFEGIGNKTRLQQVCTIVMTPEGLRRVCQATSVPNPDYYVGRQANKNSIVKAHMYSVRDALDWIVDINAANSSLDTSQHAQALINLGDWFFLNSMRDKAFQNYKQAYQLLDKDMQNQETLEALFGNPVLLPSMIKNPNIDDENVNKTESPYVKLEFNVTINGKAKKVRVIEENNSNNARIRKLAKRYIKYSLFRPRIEDSKPVETRQMVMQLSGPILQRGSIQSIEDPSIRPGSRIRR